MSVSDAKKSLEYLYARNRKESERSLSLYLEHVIIDSIPTPQPFGKIREEWQEQRDYCLVPALEFIAGIRADYDGPRNFWFGYSKGQDKSSYIGRILNWAIAFSTKPLRIYCGAKDAEQAGVILDCMIKESKLNPWFEKRIEFKRGKAVNKKSGSELHILTSDAGGTQGKTPDIIICDELTHWEDEEFFESLVSAGPKKSGHCLLIILTNAGFKDSWQDRIRKVARSEHGRDWFFYEQPYKTQLASWIKSEEVDKIRKLMSEGEGRRLYDNEWIDLTEERGFINAEDVDNCIGKPQEPPQGATVYLGVDFGSVNDRTALSTVWFDGEVVHVVELECWQGTKDNEIQVEDVDNWIERRILRYNNVVCVFDKHQMLATIQKLENRGIRVKRFDYDGPKQNYLMAENLRTLITNKRIVYSKNAGYLHGETLSDELKSLIIKRVQSWYKFDHERSKHNDRSISVGMASLEAVMTSKAPPAKQTSKTRPRLTQRAAKAKGFSGEHFARRGYFGLH